MKNPIIDEIRKARAALAAEHDFDLVRINNWMRQQSLARQDNAKSPKRFSQSLAKEADSKNTAQAKTTQ